MNFVVFDVLIKIWKVYQPQNLSLKTSYLKTAYKVLKYFKGTTSHGKLLSKNEKLEVLCSFFRRNLVSWKSKEQKSVSRSSGKSELRALVA